MITNIIGKEQRFKYKYFDLYRINRSFACLAYRQNNIRKRVHSNGVGFGLFRFLVRRKMEFLETARLILRKFRDSDFEDFYSYAADSEMSK